MFVMQGYIPIDCPLISRYVPISSRSPALDDLCRKHKRIVIYNKSDISNPEANKKLEQYSEATFPKSWVLLTSQGQSSYRELMHKIAFNVRALSKESTRLLVVGMPNVGKSTIINRLRSLGMNNNTKAVKTGNLPGITRNVSGLVKILDEPLTYLLDSPGILMPKITSPDQGMKLSISGKKTRYDGPQLRCNYGSSGRGSLVSGFFMALSSATG